MLHIQQSIDQLHSSYVVKDVVLLESLHPGCGGGVGVLLEEDADDGEAVGVLQGLAHGAVLQVAVDKVELQGEPGKKRQLL